tara:strand:- start:484 stop:753 length:270 start_codon:yes stop_codon:yes gene_type:complete
MQTLTETIEAMELEAESLEHAATTLRASAEELRASAQVLTVRRDEIVPNGKDEVVFNGVLPQNHQIDLGNGVSFNTGGGFFVAKIEEGF